MPDRVKVTRLAIGAGALIALHVITLLLVRPVPDAIVSLLGGPDGGVARLGGVRVRYRPPADLPPRELARYLEQAAVRREGDGALALELPGVAEDMIGELSDVLAGGGVAMREALETSYAEDLARLLPGEVQPQRPGRSRAPPEGVVLARDHWRTEDGGPHDVAYLEAGSRGELARVLAAAAARGLRSSPGIVLGFERIDAYADRPARWRTYELAAEVVVDGTMIARARREADRQVGRPIVMLELTREGARRFCEATRRLVGRKLAIVLGGRIRSAPIIMSEICGGRISVTVGGGDGAPGAQEREAEMLAAVLSQPSLPPGGVVEAASWHPAPSAAAQEWAGRLLLGLGAGALGGLLVALAIRRLRPRWRRLPEPTAVGPFPFRRLAVTLAAPVALYVGGKVVLPGLDPVQVDHLLGWGGDARTFSVLALGATPILTAFVLVELAALAIPPLRWRRHDPRGRVRLGQATAALAIVLALAQGYFVAVYLEAHPSNALVASLGLGFRLLAMVTLAAGTLLLGALAGVIREHGLGNGYGALIAAGALVDLAPLLAAADEARPLGGGHALGLVTLAVIAAFTAALLRWRISDDAGGAGGTGGGSDRAVALRLPASGIAPLSDAAGLVLLLGLIGGFGLGAAVAEPALAVRELGASPWLALGLIAVLAPVWAYVFARPGLVAPAARAAGLPAPAWSAWGRAALASAALLAAVYGLAASAASADEVAAALAAPALAMLGTAVVLDVIDDARAHRRRLAPAAVLHQIQRAGVVERVLADAGIPCHVHAGNLRALLAFFGPFAPAIVLVPESLAADARRALEGIATPAPTRS